MGNSTPCKIVTPKNFILKLCTRDYVGEVTRQANFCFNRYSGGFSPSGRHITTLWLFLTVLSVPFFSRSYAQIEPLDRFSRFTTCFRARMVLLGVRTMGDHIWGKYAPKTPQKWASIGNFQCNSACCYIGGTSHTSDVFNVSLHYSVHSPSSFTSQIRANTHARTDRPTTTRPQTQQPNIWL